MVIGGAIAVRLWQGVSGNSALTFYIEPGIGLAPKFLLLILIFTFILQTAKE